MVSEDRQVIRRVYVWQNGMVMVFGLDGQQIPEFQGPREEVWDAIQEQLKRDLDAPDYQGVEINENAVWR